MSPRNCCRCQRDQIINELIGATQKMAIEYVFTNPNPDPAKFRDILVKEVESEVLTTLDCSTAFPVGANYIGKRNEEETYNDMKLCVKQIEICKGCLENVNHDLSCIRDNGDLCNSSCVICSKKGYTNIDPSLTTSKTMSLLRPGSRSMGREMQCRKLVVIFSSSDCGSN